MALYIMPATPATPASAYILRAGKALESSGIRSCVGSAGGLSKGDSVLTESSARFECATGVSIVCVVGPGAQPPFKPSAWVARDAWEAAAVHGVGGPSATRIIYDYADTDVYVPSEQQRLVATRRPVVLHDGKSPTSDIEAELANTFVICHAAIGGADEPDTLREGDLWLCLSEAATSDVMVVRALSTGLIVVGPNTGLLWPGHNNDESAAVRHDMGVVTFGPTADAAGVAAAVRLAWKHRARLHGRSYARRWLSMPVAARKWAEIVSHAGS